MTSPRQLLKKLVFGLMGKDPEAVVVTFLTGDQATASAMASEIRQLVPDRRHYVVSQMPGSAVSLFRKLRRDFRRLRIGQAAVLFTADRDYHPLRLAAFLLAPGRILAYNARLERHHLRLRTWIASWLFLRGVAVDRIFLRPWWLCPWKKDRTTVPSTYELLEGRPLSASRRRVAVLSPYFPYPLSHGGAVRIFHLLREAARRYDIFLFAFTEDGEPLEPGPVLEFCAQVILVPKPRYREPRWSTLLPPEVHEYRSPVMRRLLDEARRIHSTDLLQVEYTQLAPYGGDVLVEHDVTHDLYRQVRAVHPGLSTWWDWLRWSRFERKAVQSFRRVVSMSAKDTALLDAPQVREIPNGVDLERFRPAAERPGQCLLFIGSFRHFPNVIAYRFFAEEVWPLIRDEFPEMTLTAVAGPDPLTYWQAAAGTQVPAVDPRIRLLEFVRDVRPLYKEANLVLVPTLVSAGTNVKVLEAMAMERAVISTSCGCAGLGLEHGTSVWIADDAGGFAEGVRRLIADDSSRAAIARAARRHAENRFSWRRLGVLQRALWGELLGSAPTIREAVARDLPQIAAIQAVSPESASWSPESYLGQGCLVAMGEDGVNGFVAFRRVDEKESEILNLAVAPAARRRGIASSLVDAVIAQVAEALFLEVRASNIAARNLYQKLGFLEIGLRRAYYNSPPEDGIVMRLQS